MNINIVIIIENESEFCIPPLSLINGHLNESSRQQFHVFAWLNHTLRFFGFGFTTSRVLRFVNYYFFVCLSVQLFLMLLSYFSPPFVHQSLYSLQSPSFLLGAPHLTSLQLLDAGLQTWVGMRPIKERIQGCQPFIFVFLAVLDFTEADLGDGLGWRSQTRVQLYHKRYQIFKLFTIISCDLWVLAL